MIEIREATTKAEQRAFLNFPLDLYRDNPYFVPPLYMDEKKIFAKDYVYNDTCEAVYYNAYRDGKIVGRVSGILQKVSNDIRSEKRVRFTRFDAINDQEVANALFDQLQQWALSRGMDTLVGPLGFSDLEREGLLVEGFDQLSTFEEQYNAEYYQHLIENWGFTKEVDWLESRLKAPKQQDETLEKMVAYVMRRYGLHFGTAKNVRDFIDRYADQMFELLDEGYQHLYGTVPFTEGMKKMTIANFLLIVDLRFVAVILDKDENVVCLGISFPSIARAVQKSRGHITPAAAVRLLRAIKKPSILELGLVAVKPEYANRGISAAIIVELMRMLREDGIEYAETNLNLEDNAAIRNQWKRFDSVEHKRRRSYVRRIAPEA